MKLSKHLLLFTLIFPAALLLQNCADDPTGFDFSTAPEPYDRSAAVRDTTMEGGLEVYVIEEGSGPFEVTPNDQIQVRYTGRTTDGEIFDSTYRPSSTSNNTTALRNLTPGPKGQVAALIEGFRKGLVGMKEGEKRSIVIPPELGYADARSGTNGFNLRGETLVFDVELVSIY